MTAILNAQPHALYRFFDSEGALLYVGITNNPGRRWSDHRRQKDWWHEVANVTVEKFASRAGALMAESAAIETEGPRHNIAGQARILDPSLVGDSFDDTLYAGWDHDVNGSIFSAFPLCMKGEDALLVMCHNAPPVPLSFSLGLATTLRDHAAENGAQLWLDTRNDNYKVRGLLTRSLHHYVIDWRPFTTHQQRAKVGGLRVAVTPELFAALDGLDPECLPDERTAR